MAERDDGGLLARWSQRKAAARRGELEPEAEAAVEPAPATPAPEAEPAEPALPDLPDPDTLDASSDFKAFLKPGVPPELKIRALRRLWRVDPFYSRHDGLDDCCGDFTDSARVVKDLKTVYKVGRGMIERIIEADTASPPPAAPSQAEIAPKPAAPDERPEPEQLSLDHEPVSAAGVAEPAPPERARQAGTPPMTGNAEGRRRLPRRG